MVELIVRISILFLVAAVSPAISSPVELEAEGTAIFFDSDGSEASAIVGEDLPDEFKKGLRLYWNGHGFREEYRAKEVLKDLHLEPMREGDWSRVDLEMTLLGNDDLLDVSTDIIFYVHVRSNDSRNQFWGEKTVKVHRRQRNAFRGHWIDDLHIRLEEIDDPEVSYSRIDRLYNLEHQRKELPEAVDETIRIYKIEGMDKYLDLLANVLNVYLAHGYILDLDKISFLQDELPQDSRFASLSVEDKARKMHQFASSLKQAPGHGTLDGTNSITHQDIALNLLRKVTQDNALRRTSTGETLPEPHQKAYLLETQILCDMSWDECNRQMYHIYGIDERTPFAGEHMWAMLQAYMRELVRESRLGQPAGGDEVFIDYVHQDKWLHNDWALIHCVIKQHGSRYRFLQRKLDSTRNEGVWIQGLVDRGVDCSKVN